MRRGSARSGSGDSGAGACCWFKQRSAEHWKIPASGGNANGLGVMSLGWVFEQRRLIPKHILYELECAHLHSLLPYVFPYISDEERFFRYSSTTAHPVQA